MFLRSSWSVEVSVRPHKKRGRVAARSAATLSLVAGPHHGFVSWLSQSAACTPNGDSKTRPARWVDVEVPNLMVGRTPLAGECHRSGRNGGRHAVSGTWRPADQ